MRCTMLALVPVAALVLAAGPAPRGRPLSLAVTPGLSSDAPVLGSPAPAGGSAYQSAPVPDRDLSAPAAAENSGPQFDPTLFTPRRQFRGDGFTPGSTEQNVAQKNMGAAPGFNLKVPLETVPPQQLQP